jgi:hypothetical protein
MGTSTFLKSVAASKLLAFWIAALLIGQVLFWVGFGALYIVALVAVLAVGLPYPKAFGSVLSRVVVGFLLALSIIQVAAVVQFFALPGTRFGVVSLLVTIIVCLLIWALRGVPRSPARRWTRADTAGIVTALFFVLPLGGLCFWQNDLARLATFASVQGSDGGSHYVMLTEMGTTQHLNYQSAAYYPKGFHIASAFMMSGLRVTQSDQDWAANARVYVGMYVAWGAVVAYLVTSLACQLSSFLPRHRRPSEVLLGVSVGPVLAGVYLCVFAQEGFLSFFYILAAILAGVLYILDGKFDSPLGRWSLVAYLLLVFGVAMSWGPLLTPALLVIPLLYLWPGSLKALAKMVVAREWRWVVLAFALQVVPLYLHFRYAHLSSDQGLNATGGLKDFDYGVVVAGLALTYYLLVRRHVPDEWRRFVGNVVLPLFALLGLFVAFQLVTVGELRYYSIKISYVLEIILLAVAVAILASRLQRRHVAAIHRWIAVPLVIGLGTVLLASMTTNPLGHARILFGNLTHPQSNPDAARYALLGTSGQLSSNTASLHYMGDKLVGNAVLANWAHLMQYTSDNTVASGGCNGRIFQLQTHQAPADQVVSAVKDCIAAAKDRGKPYLVITDPSSAARLKELLGEGVKFIY